MAQAGITQRRYNFLPLRPVHTLKFCKQGLVGATIEAAKDLLLDGWRRRCRILGKPRSQSLCDTRPELRRIGDDIGTTQLQVSGCRERQERWRLVD